MPAGGIIQLLAYGSQNIKLNGNPSITFFKKVYKQHSNFSMESTQVSLNRTTANIFTNTIFKAKIPRHGDLVQQIYFVFELPDIQRNNYKFRWIDNIGEAFIDNYYCTIGGSLIDRQTGEYLHINNMLTFTNEKRGIYNKLIGNVDELTYPSKKTGIYPFINPVIKSRKIYVPLAFWFNKDSGSSLPLVSLQYSETEITIETRPFIHLYQLFKNGVYTAPDLENTDERLSSLVYNELYKYLFADSVLNINAYLEVNYYFVDTKEREYITYNSHEYLIEQVYRVDRYNIVDNTTFDMILQNPVKELIWVFKRTDLVESNNWFDFTDEGRSIMNSAKILFNGIDRIDYKDNLYFNYIQPLQHHTCNKDGVYVYSFSLNPEDFPQISGSCNMSRINRIQLALQIIKPLFDSYAYDLTVYAINYNFLKISSGLAGVVFSN